MPIEAASVSVRSAGIGDVASMAAIHLRAATQGYRNIFPPDAPALSHDALVGKWQELVSNELAEVLIAAIDGQVVGTVMLEPDEVDGSWWLKRLHVDPEYWGHGIGSVLHDEAITTAWQRGVDQLNLWVLEQNDRARQMYERRSWNLVPGSTLENDPPTVVDVRYTRAVIPARD